MHAFFGFARNADSATSFSDVVGFEQRTLAECTHFLCARRAKIPEMLLFGREILAQNLRDLEPGCAYFQNLTDIRLGCQFR